MTEVFDLVTAGRQTDYSVFWHYFDNYIVTASRQDYLDELVIALYLADRTHANFYERLWSAADPLHLVLVHRRWARPDQETSGGSMKKGLFHHIYRARRRDSRTYLEAHNAMTTNSDGECIGFCIYEWNHSVKEPGRILALSIDPGSTDHTRKSRIWQMLERSMFNDGIRTLETTSYQEPEFWKRNGFQPTGINRLSKKL